MSADFDAIIPITDLTPYSAALLGYVRAKDTYSIRYVKETGTRRYICFNQNYYDLDNRIWILRVFEKHRRHGKTKLKLIGNFQIRTYDELANLTGTI